MIDWAIHIPTAKEAAAKLLRRLPRGVVAIEELEQDALIGLHAAAGAFDDSRGVKFTTFAAQRIRGAMLDGLRQRDVLTRTQRRKGVTSPLSIEAIKARDDGRTVEIGDESALDPLHQLSEGSVLKRAVELLPTRQLAAVIRLRFGDGMTHAEIGRRLGLSESRISQLFNQALQIIRASVTVSERGELVFTDRSTQIMSTNGVSNGALARREPNTQLDVGDAVNQLQELPPWLKAMREAMEGAVSGDDIKAVMKKQVEKAKDGDMKAASFVMNQAHKLMQSAGVTRPVTIVQNNYYDSTRPDAPIEPGDDADGSDLKKMRSRARAGLPLTGLPGDTRLRPVSDEEEKELRRRQAAEEEAA